MNTRQEAQLLIADAIEAMADSNYRRDISGRLAREGWAGFAKVLREGAASPSDDEGASPLPPSEAAPPSHVVDESWIEEAATRLLTAVQGECAHETRLGAIRAYLRFAAKSAGEAAPPEVDVQLLAWAVSNCHTLARRRIRAGVDLEYWEHVQRICEKVGARSKGVLRASLPTEITEGSGGDLAWREGSEQAWKEACGSDWCSNCECVRDKLKKAQQRIAELETELAALRSSRTPPAAEKGKE